VDVDGGDARQLTLGVRHDHWPRFSPDGSLAFLSDRRLQVEEEPEAGDTKDREDASQVHLLPLNGGEARRVTDLPRGVTAFEWSPDGRRLLCLSSSVEATRKADARRRGTRPKPRPGQPPESDSHFVDRLGYLANGVGFVYHTRRQIWLVDVATGSARRLTDEPAGIGDAAWSPDGTRIAYTTNLDRNWDLADHSHLVVVDVESGARTTLSGPASIFFAPAWMPDGRSVAAFGGYVPDNYYRSDIWLLAADGGDAQAAGGRNLSGRHDLMPRSTFGSDIVPAEEGRLVSSADGRWLSFLAPIDGSQELWRISTADGGVERLTTGRHVISSFDQIGLGRGRTRTVWLRSSPTELSDVWVRDGSSGAPRRLTDLNREVLAEIELRQPLERRVTVDGRSIQGWYLPAIDAKRNRPGPVVTQIHGGPHTFYGWALTLEFQLLAGNGMGVFYSNPRGSEGYGRAFNQGNRRDWGPGPARDVLAGVDALVADGLADPYRLGLAGGSYGGYLTNWIVGHDDRFRAAMTCRTVSDMNLLFVSGDIASGFWPRLEFRSVPWEDPAYFREISPLTYANRIRTPLLIQHAEKDIRTIVAQAEALFTVLRSLRRPVRLLRVPEETHELTRSGTPFRRVENLTVVRDWFRHYLVERRRGLPPLPRSRGGK
jgi:acylaminoacyl-peptidase